MDEEMFVGRFVMVNMDKLDIILDNAKLQLYFLLFFG